MKDELIKEGNELFAIFLGSDREYDAVPELYYWTFDPELIQINDIVLGSSWICGNFQFHCSWNWLMPVYEKIIRQKLDSLSEELVIKFITLSDRLIDADGIEEVWKEIVEFIKIYNKLKE